MITPYEGYVQHDRQVNGSPYFTGVLVNMDDPDHQVTAMFSRNDLDPADVPLVVKGARFYLMAEDPIVIYKQIPRHSITFIRPRTGA